MNFTETGIPGAYLLRPERFEDERGFFARTWSEEEFAARGLEGRLSYTAASWNRRKHTLRGMHYQAEPFEEAKLVSCVRGAVHDVLVDLRPASPAFRRWFAARLDPAGEALYVPRGVAHGFLTLEDDTLVNYFVAERWSPEHARGVRWDDPVFGIEWPARPAVIAPRDRDYPDFPGAQP
jgi:dTDP-4-dehydrorhamnose 3,5-epimerase